LRVAPGCGGIRLFRLASMHQIADKQTERVGADA